MKSLRKSKGITLIALVVTIIVLLILAGVAISMLSGENGILNQAAKAKEETERGETDEAVELAVLSALTVGKGEIQGKDAFEILNKELKNAGYKGKEITELPKTVTIGDESFIINQDGNISEPLPIEKLKLTGEVVQENTTLTDKNGYSITIPKNFNIASTSPIEVTKGMIIEDSKDNQYVWIPIFSNEKLDWGVDYTEVESSKQYTDEYYTAIETALKNYTNTYINNSYKDEWYGNGKYGNYTYTDLEGNIKYYTNGNMSEEQYKNLYNNMLNSIYLNEGFYVGRYEMGIGVATSANDENDNTSAQSLARLSMTEYKSTETNTDNQVPSIEGMAIPVSKVNAVVYNYITQSQAQMLAEELGKGADYNNVNSSIMFGIQWDAVCVFIENFDTNNTATTKKEWLTKNDYSRLWGNYKNSTFTLERGFYSSDAGKSWKNGRANTKSNTTSWFCTSGATERNSSLNIYDFAGNVAEWTLEKYNDVKATCVYRGIYYNLGYYASYRGCYRTYYSHDSITSRVSLCIK